MGSRLTLVATLAALPLLPPAVLAGEQEGENAAAPPLESSQQQQVSEALQAVEEAWAEVESATADRWRSAKETFDQAVIDLERTWNEVTTDGEPPPTDPTSRGGD